MFSHQSLLTEPLPRNASLQRCRAPSLSYLHLFQMSHFQWGSLHLRHPLDLAFPLPLASFSPSQQCHSNAYVLMPTWVLGGRYHCWGKGEVYTVVRLPPPPSLFAQSSGLVYCLCHAQVSSHQMGKIHTLIHLSSGQCPEPHSSHLRSQSDSMMPHAPELSFSTAPLLSHLGQNGRNIS